MIAHKEQSQIDAAEEEDEEDEEDKDDQEAGTQRADGAPRRLLLWPINHGRSAPQYFTTLKISARGSFDYSFFKSPLFFFGFKILFPFVSVVSFCCMCFSVSLLNFTWKHFVAVFMMFMT